MAKIVWLITFAMALAALILYPLGLRHYSVAVAVATLAVLCTVGLFVLILLLFGGPIYL